MRCISVLRDGQPTQAGASILTKGGGHVVQITNQKNKGGATWNGTYFEH